MFFPAKASYFFFYAALAGLMPFLVLYYKSVGLNPQEIGLLSAVYPLMMLFGAPLWSALADASRRYKAVLLVAYALSLLAVFALMAGGSFRLMLLSLGLFAFMLAPIMPMTDNAVLKLLGAHKERYGRLRLWGAIGWGLSAPVVGWLTSKYSLSWAFYCFFILMFCAALSSIYLPLSPKTPSGTLKKLSFQAQLKNFTSPLWLLFLLSVFIAGMSMAVCANFVYLYMADLNASRITIGLLLSFATLGEVPMLFLGARLLKRWQPRELISFSLLVFTLRLVLYAFTTSPWLIVFIQLSHGLSFSVLWLAGVARADKLAPQGLGATAQGLFTAVCMGLGGVLGNALGGVLYQHYGARMTFFIMALITLSVFIVRAVLEKRYTSLASA